MYKLNVYVMGNPITIQSQVDSDEFVKLLVQLINDQGSSPNWSGWNTFEKIKRINLLFLFILE